MATNVNSTRKIQVITSYPENNIITVIKTGSDGKEKKLIYEVINLGYYPPSPVFAGRTKNAGYPVPHNYIVGVIRGSITRKYPKTECYIYYVDDNTVNYKISFHNKSNVLETVTGTTARQAVNKWNAVSF
jgi:hypothetical protein